MYPFPSEFVCAGSLPTSTPQTPILQLLPRRSPQRSASSIPIPPPRSTGQQGTQPKVQTLTLWADPGVQFQPEHVTISNSTIGTTGLG